MNRRSFLKKLGIACGAAVACPAKLLKSEPKHLWMAGKDGCRIEGEDIPYGIPYWVGNRARNIVILDEFVTPRDDIFFRNVPLYYWDSFPA